MRCRRLAVAAILSSPPLVGCWHTDVVRTRPGDIDVRTPPVNAVVDVPERPRDPGERYLVFSPGIFGGAGISLEDSQGSRAAYSLGAEASLHYGTRQYSHADDDFFIYPDRAYGLNAGWTMVSQARVGPSVGYLEAQYFDTLFGGAAGWAWDPARAQSGPQATIFAGPLYLRVTHIDGDRTEITLGLFAKVPYSWVWAR